jgi:hypothetical protein
MISSAKFFELANQRNLINALWEVANEEESKCTPERAFKLAMNKTMGSVDPKAVKEAVDHYFG